MKCPVNLIAWHGEIVRYESINLGYAAWVLRTGEPLGVSAELRQAIEMDIAKQVLKGQ